MLTFLNWNEEALCFECASNKIVTYDFEEFQADSYRFDSTLNTFFPTL